MNIETINAINLSSVAFIAVLGAFTIFRLGWLRKEMDDYKNRLILLISQNKEEVCLDDKLRLSAIEEKRLNKTADDLWGMTDKEFEELFKKIKDITKKEGEKIYHIKDLSLNAVTTLEGSYKLFEKRLLQKNTVLEYWKLSVSIFLGSFFLTLLGLSGSLVIRQSIFGELFLVAYISGSILVFVELYFQFKNDI